MIKIDLAYSAELIKPNIVNSMPRTHDKFQDILRNLGSESDEDLYKTTPESNQSNKTGDYQTLENAEEVEQGAGEQQSVDYEKKSDVNKDLFIERMESLRVQARERLIKAKNNEAVELEAIDENSFSGLGLPEKLLRDLGLVDTAEPASGQKPEIPGKPEKTTNNIKGRAILSEKETEESAITADSANLTREQEIPVIEEVIELSEETAANQELPAEKIQAKVSGQPEAQAEPQLSVIADKAQENTQGKTRAEGRGDQSPKHVVTDLRSQEASQQGADASGKDAKQQTDAQQEQTADVRKEGSVEKGRVEVGANRSQGRVEVVQGNTENSEAANQPAKAQSSEGLFTVRQATEGRSETLSQASQTGRTAFSHTLERFLRQEGINSIVRKTGILLKNDNQGEIRLILKPERLGQVRIRLQLEDKTLAGRIIVENSSVKDVFQGNLDELADALKESGFEGAELEVAVDDKRGEDSQGNSKSNQDSKQARHLAEIESSTPVVGITSQDESEINLMA